MFATQEFELAHCRGDRADVGGAGRSESGSAFRARARHCPCAAGKVLGTARRHEPRTPLARQFIGEIDEQQKSDFLGQASALMFLIDWPEPFGLSMIEAMACGTPVLALRRGSVEEVVEDGLTGHIVDSIEEAAVALPRVMALNRRAVRRRFEERFTAKRMASDYLRVYKALLKRENAKLIANQVEPLFETAAEPTAEPIELAQR
jgi:hypothetical protein